MCVCVCLFVCVCTFCFCATKSSQEVGCTSRYSARSSTCSNDFNWFQVPRNVQYKNEDDEPIGTLNAFTISLEARIDWDTIGVLNRTQISIIAYHTIKTKTLRSLENSETHWKNQTVFSINASVMQRPIVFSSIKSSTAGKSKIIKEQDVKKLFEMRSSHALATKSLAPG